MSGASAPPAPLELDLERRPNSEVSLTVTAPPEEVERAVEVAIRQLSPRVRIPGFRPGKAPRPVVERAVGWDAIRQEALDWLLPLTYQRALEDLGLDPVTPPQVEPPQFAPGEPFRFTAVFTVRPEVELGDYRALRVEAEPAAVPEADVEAGLQELRQQHAQLTTVNDRPATPADRVVAELTMHRGQEPVGTPGQTYTLDLDRPDALPGLAAAIAGHRAGEQFEFPLTLPADYPREELQGAEVRVTAQLREVHEKVLPALDDNLASIAGRGETLDELRAAVRADLEQRAAAGAATQFETTVLDRALALATVEVPEAMVQAEIERQLRDLEMRLQAAGLSVEQYLQATQQTVEQLRGERRQPATERVTLELVLEAVARAEGLTVPDPELDQALARIFRAGERDARRRAREPLRREMLRRAATERLLQIARGEAADPA